MIHYNVYHGCRGGRGEEEHFDQCLLTAGQDLKNFVVLSSPVP